MTQKTAAGVTSYFGAFEVSPTGTLTKYIQAGERVIAKKEGSARYWYHADRLGSVRLLTDVNGAVVNRYAYTPYGAYSSKSGSVANSIGFTGHRFDADTGLVFMKARYYDPSVGRFTSPDSILPNPYDPQALNRYSYVYNNPVTNTDPTGHVPVAVAFIGMAAAGYTTLAVAAFVCTTVGYFAHNEFLMSVGAIMSGYATGGPLGAAVAGITSPISPMGSKLKEAVSWAYMAYGLMQRFGGSANEPLLLAAADIPGDEPIRIEITGHRLPFDNDAYLAGLTAVTNTLQPSEGKWDKKTRRAIHGEKATHTYDGNEATRNNLSKEQIRELQQDKSLMEENNKKRLKGRDLRARGGPPAEGGVASLEFLLRFLKVSFVTELIFYSGPADNGEDAWMQHWRETHGISD